jgi:hypothetical protein
MLNKQRKIQMKNIIKTIKTKIVPHIIKNITIYAAILNFGLSLVIAYNTYNQGNIPACMMSCLAGGVWILVMILGHQINFLIKEINRLIEIKKED